MATKTDNASTMDIWGHLADLRKRLVIAAGALLLAVVISMFLLAEPAIEFLTRPAGGLQNFVTIEVTESIGTYMRVALLTGFILALPVIVWQILLFVVPGLEKNEKRWLFSAIPIATLLFLSGAAFAYYIMLYFTLPFLANFMQVEAAWRIANYITFVTSLIFWIGLSFEMPLVVYLLARLGIVKPRALARHWRIAIVVIAVVAAVITPTPDPLTMGLTMLPLFAIYMLSILFAFMAFRDRESQRANEG